MATVQVIKESIMICREAIVTPFIWGHRGLGKSSLVRQITQDNGWGFIDLRCSQIEASDIRGLPDRVGDRTCYLPPADMPIGDLSTQRITQELADTIGVESGNGDVFVETMKRMRSPDLETRRLYYQKLQQLQPRFPNGILFVDEVNRAQDDVLQAIFQLVLDHKVGQYVLPPGWSVVAAGNFQEGYMVTGFNDPAFLDRFCHMTLSIGETTLEEWVQYMTQTHGEAASDVVEFASQNMRHLDGDVEGELGFSIQPSRRSWEQVVRVRQAHQRQQFSDEATLEVLAGLLGREIALSFSRYSCPVKPGALLKSGVSAYESKLRTLNRNQLTGLMWGLVSMTKERIHEKEVADVCLDLASYMIHNMWESDIVVAFCRALIGDGKITGNREKVKAAMITNPRFAHMVSRFNRDAGNKKDFVDRLMERPELQEALSKVSWGIDP